MAKEVNLKRIELKVSVNCCDGCKRKVKKALRNVEGVLKTEIDSTEPKLTVIGNMDPLIVMKKLSKVGKKAEMLSITNAAAEATKEREKTKPESGRDRELPKYADTVSVKSNEHKTNYADAGEKEGSKREQNKTCNNSRKENENMVTETCKEVIKNETAPQYQTDQGQVSFNMYPSMVHSQYCCKVAAVPIPSYAVPSYSYPYPPLMPAMSYGNYQDYYYYNIETPPVFQQPQFQAPVIRAGDYFSEENTAGCHIM